MDSRLLIIIIGLPIYLFLLIYFRRYRQWLLYYLFGAFGLTMLITLPIEYLNWDYYLIGVESFQANLLGSLLGISGELLENGRILLQTGQQGQSILKIGIECSGVLEAGVLIGLVAFYPVFRARSKFLKIVFGLAVTYLINILRLLIIIVVVAKFGTDYIFIAHAVIARLFFFSLAIALYWYILTKPTLKIVGEATDEQKLAHEIHHRPGRARVIRRGVKIASISIIAALFAGSFALSSDWRKAFGPVANLPARPFIYSEQTGIESPAEQGKVLGASTEDQLENNYQYIYDPVSATIIETFNGVSTGHKFINPEKLSADTWKGGKPCEYICTSKWTGNDLIEGVDNNEDMLAFKLEGKDQYYLLVRVKTRETLGLYIKEGSENPNYMWIFGRIESGKSVWPAMTIQKMKNQADSSTEAVSESDQNFIKYVKSINGYDGLFRAGGRGLHLKINNFLSDTISSKSKIWKDELNICGETEIDFSTSNLWQRLSDKDKVLAPKNILIWPGNSFAVEKDKNFEVPVYIRYKIRDGLYIKLSEANLPYGYFNINSQNGRWLVDISGLPAGTYQLQSEFILKANDQNALKSQALLYDSAQNSYLEWTAEKRQVEKEIEVFISQPYQITIDSGGGISDDRASINSCSATLSMAKSYGQVSADQSKEVVAVEQTAGADDQKLTEVNAQSSGKVLGQSSEEENPLDLRAENIKLRMQVIFLIVLSTILAAISLVLTVIIIYLLKRSRNKERQRDE